MKKFKELSKLFIAVLVVSCGIGLVNADSKVTGGYTSLSTNGTYQFDMSDCSYGYFFGSAIGTSSGYLKFTLNRLQSWIYHPLAGQANITGISSSSYSTVGPFPTLGSDDYRSVYKAINSGFSGNAQTTNSTSSTLNI